MILSRHMLPIPPNKSCKMHGYYCIFNDSEPAHAPHPAEQIMQMHGYYCIRNDSEPAHAPHPTEQIMENEWMPLYFQWFWACPCSPSHRTNHQECMDTVVFSMILSLPMLPIPPSKSWKLHGYYCIFNDSEPAHAPHPTEQIMKNAWILLYFQWFWARPCSPSHRTNHEKCMGTILFLMILSLPMLPIPHENAWILLNFQWLWARPCSPSHRTNHEKCMETIEFAMFLARPCSPLHDTNHAKYATEISRNNAFVMDYNVFQSLGVAEYYESCWKMGWCWKIVTWFKPKCHQVF